MAERVVKVTLRADVADYKKGMEEAARKTATVGTESEKLAQKREAFEALGRGMMVVGGAMTALSVGVLATGVAYNTLQQTSRAALTTLLGSAEAANAQMDKLDEFARTSPFSKSVFIQAQQQMLGFGVAAEDVVPALDAIQNAVAAMGGDNAQISALAEIMARIKSEGRLSGDALQRMGYYGIDAATIIGSEMGKTSVEIRDMASKPGGIPVDQIWDPLVNGLQKKFGGAADNVKQTFSGAMDRVQAAWRDLSSDLAKPLVDPNGGGALVDFLNWTADIMRAFQALPEPIKLTGGAMFALAGFITLASGAALAAVPKYVALKESFMALSATMRGIAIAGGVAVLALTAIVAVIGAVAAAHAAAEARAQSYADALAQGSDAALDVAASAATAEKSFLWLSRGSAADAAGKLGLSLDLVGDAVTGNAAALEEVNTAIEKAFSPANTKAAKDLTQQENEAAAAAQELKGYVEEQTAAYESGTKILDQRNEMTAESVEASGTAAESYMQEADAVSDLNSELAGLIDKINEANGIAGDAITANANYQSALAGISDEVQKQKDAYEEANGTLDGFNASLDRNTESGSSNAAMLWGVASAAQGAAEKQFAQDQATMSADDAATKYLTTLGAQRQAFIDSATSAGFNADEVNALADEIFKMPSKKEVAIIAETAAAQGAIDRLVINNSGRRITITADVNYQAASGITVTPNAAGGLYANGVKAFAGGGMEPGIYPYRPGGIHKFAEEYAEGYVSMDPRRRAKSEGVWTAIGNHMGFGQGGVGSSSGAPAEPAQINVNVRSKGGLNLLDYVDVRVEQVSSGLNDALRG